MTDFSYIPVLPSEGFVDTKQIIGDRRNNIPGVLPISASTWHEGRRTGRYNLKEIKHGGRTLFPVEGEDGVRALLERIRNESATT
ncbi:MAG: AlpA family transcriptional regulator [Gammaproteobacteria bacterium]|jgi:hypothetical protein|nr:AlpA family transcriptional regulator [Gammaproteobacteria bacterium]